MDLKFQVFDGLCEMKIFIINGIEASYEDFGYEDDCDPDNAEPYGCGDMRFSRKPATEQILNNYKISHEEYEKICDKLEEGLSFRGCRLCI